jgi:hypothetical protein
MRKFAIYALAGMLALPVSIASAAPSQPGGLKPPQSPPAYTPTPLGFSSALCVADGISGAKLTNINDFFTIGQVTVRALSTVYLYDSNGNSAINVAISNGTTTASYTIIFQDSTTTGSLGSLDCGDLIIAVIPYAA